MFTQKEEIKIGNTVHWHVDANLSYVTQRQGTLHYRCQEVWCFLCSAPEPCTKETVS